MDVALFDFDLPEASIALRPAEPRDAARMLVVQPGAPLRDRHVPLNLIFGAFAGIALLSAVVVLLIKPRTEPASMAAPSVS